MTSIEKSEKFAPPERYFNISVLWIFYYRSIIRMFYQLRVPHEAVTLLSIGIGLFAAWMFYQGQLVAAAVAIHFKDIFDACDGALARLTGRGHLIGRYLDSVGDFFALTAVIAAITARAVRSGAPDVLIWGVLAWISLFIQCSFFNFYQLAYADQVGKKRLSSRRDERSRDDLDARSGTPTKRLLLVLLRFFYLIIYSWQDKLVAAVDRHLRAFAGRTSDHRWYGDKRLLTLQSPLCFGTHIFVIIIFALLGMPQNALLFIATVMNAYLVLVLAYRVRWARREIRPGAGAGTG